MKLNNDSLELLGKRLFETFTEPVKYTDMDPDPKAVKAYVQRTAYKTASLSAALAVPGGVAGLISMVPELAAVWRMQTQMVGSIARTYGYEKTTGPEQMMWCMMRQFGMGVVSKYVFQKGGVYVVRRMNSDAARKVAGAIGVNLLKLQGSRAASRLIPLAGSVASGALSYRDTHRVGHNALRLYSTGIEFGD